MSSTIPKIEGDLLVGLAKTVGPVEAMQLSDLRERCEGLTDRQISLLMRASIAIDHMPRDADGEAMTLMGALEELRRAWFRIKELESRE